MRDPRTNIELRSVELLFDNLHDSPEQNGEWLTTDEAAFFLRISTATLRNLSSNGKVPYYKWQRRNRYRKSELTQLLLSQKRGV